jgi:hypothetical protein
MMQFLSWKAVIGGGLLFIVIPAYYSLALAASCCGGGSASSLVMPKFSRAMVDVSVDMEQYHGYWNKNGEHVPDPPNSDLTQYRLNVG